VHGASMMNQNIQQSNFINSQFKTYFLPLNFVNKVEHIGSVSIIKLLKMFAFIFRLIYRLLTIRPELVYYTIAPYGGAFYRDALFVFIIKIFRVKLLFHIHGKGISEEVTNSFKRKIYQLTYSNVSVITLSKTLDYDVEPIYHGKIYNVPNGIEIKKHEFKTSSEAQINVLYLSNLVKTKGVLDLIKAVEIMPKIDVDYTVNIVGNSADLTVEELQLIVQEKNLSSKIKVLGPKYGDEKWQALTDADIFVFPSYFKNECFPLALLEAMQSGCAIISTNNGAIKEIIENCGIIISQNAPGELSNALNQFLTDPIKVESLKTKAKKEFNENYRIEIFEKKLTEVLFQVLK
jgi:glycosyltransferase involved in cell wall biosynthesis